MTAISIVKPKEIRINNRVIPYAEEVTALGLKIKRNGISTHIKNKLAMAKREVAKLKRFKRLPEKQKIHLLKAFILPLLTYPAVPLCTTSKFNLKAMQIIINKYIRQVARDELEENETLPTTEELHIKYKIKPINILLYEQTIKTWDKLRLINEEMTRLFEEEEEKRPHSWWPRVADIVNGEPPTPIYVYS